MTLTIDLPENEITILHAKASAAGVSAEQCAAELLKERLRPKQPESRSPGEFVRSGRTCPTMFAPNCRLTPPANTIATSMAFPREMLERGLR